MKLIASLAILATVSFAARLPTTSSQGALQAQAETEAAVAKPCDYSCCPCAKKSFDFSSLSDKAATPAFRSNRSESPFVVTSSSDACIPCGTFTSRFIRPEYRDHCGTVSCQSSPLTVLPADWSLLPNKFWAPKTSCDTPKDYVHADGSVVRHVNGVNTTYPPNWGTQKYGNGWGRTSYFYPIPETTTSSIIFAHRHHRGKANASANATAEAESQAQVQAKVAEFLKKKSEIDANLGANVPTVRKIMKKEMPAPCDFKCCSCAEKTFRFAKNDQVRFAQANSTSTSQCLPCSSWVSKWVKPEMKDSCQCSGTTFLNPTHTLISHAFIKDEFDYSDETYYYNGAARRYNPGFGVVSYPSTWTTAVSKDSDFFSNTCDGNTFVPGFFLKYYLPQMPHSDAPDWTPATADWFVS